MVKTFECAKYVDGREMTIPFMSDFSAVKTVVLGAHSLCNFAHLSWSLVSAKRKSPWKVF